MKLLSQLCTFVLLLTLQFTLNVQAQVTAKYYEGFVSDPKFFDFVPGLSQAEFLKLNDVGKKPFGGIPPQPLNLDSVRQAIGYPALAKEAGISGEVFIMLHLDSTNNAIEYTVRLDPHPLLTKAITDKIMNLRFSQGLSAEGKRIPVWVSIPFSFVLRYDNTATSSFSISTSMEGGNENVVFADWNLGKVPQEILDNRMTKNLVLTGNGLEAFPMELLEMKNLRKLRLDHNPIREIPDKLFSLPNLEFVDLRGTAIPELRLRALAKKHKGMILF